jgi:glycosyltransferase involved in cell wall biosynthesis
VNEITAITGASLAGVVPAAEELDVSFIVPAFNAQRTLPATIASIRAAAPPSSEVIVVDDGSLDDTPILAAALADQLIRRPCQGGAARSRNDGARKARGRVLVFVDADVTVTPNAVRGILAHLDGGADAAIGAYEATPPPGCRNASSMYKNLIHHYTHLHGPPMATTFWSGFGAVSREAFLAVGGFDARVSTGADVEDIHLGYRLRRAGFSIRLDPGLQVSHHKRYTFRGVIVSDFIHRAVPWTRTMLELRTLERGMNLGGQAIVGAGLAIMVPVAAVATWWLGPWSLAAAAFALGAWVAVHARLLRYAREVWSVGGAVRTAGFMYLYYLYGTAGASLGAVAYALRHGPESALNQLRLADVASADRPATDGGARDGGAEAHDRERVDVTVAVIAGPGEPLVACTTLPEPEPWWELIVVAPEGVPVPDGARFELAPRHATRNEMRQIALTMGRGTVFAPINAESELDPGWLDRVRATATEPALVVAGSFHHDTRSAVARASQILRYWQWRPERRPGWMVDHPSTNTAYRASTARALGGFRIEGALIPRLAAFGARPVRFDPEMAVTLHLVPRPIRMLLGVVGIARLRASAAARYFDMGLPHRVVSVVLSPGLAALMLTRIVREARREGTADATFWKALPLVVAGVACHVVGRDIGLLRPRLRGGLVPRRAEDLVHLEHEMPSTAIEEPQAAPSIAR